MNLNDDDTFIIKRGTEPFDKSRLKVAGSHTSELIEEGDAKIKPLDRFTDGVDEIKESDALKRGRKEQPIRTKVQPATDRRAEKKKAERLRCLILGGATILLLAAFTAYCYIKIKAL